MCAQTQVYRPAARFVTRSTMKQLLLFLCFHIVLAPAWGQTLSQKVERELSECRPESMKPVFDEMEATLATQPYDTALIAANELLHTAAQSSCMEGFEQLFRLTRRLYERHQREDDFFLYLLSIADDPAFAKPAVSNRIHYEIGYRYYELGDYSKAQVVLEKLLEQAPRMDSRDYLNVLTMLGLIFQDRNDFSNAQRFLELALNKAQAARDTAWIGLSSGNLGSLYTDIGDLKKALPLLYTDIRISRQQGLFESAANSYIEMAHIALEQQHFPLAKNALTHALDLLRSGQHTGRLATGKVYEQLSRYYGQLKQSDSAYFYLQAAKQIADSITNRRNESLLNLRVNAFQQRKADQDVLLLRANMRSSQLNRKLAIAACAVLILITVLAGLYIRQKRRNNAILREKAALVEQEKQVIEQQRNKEEAANHEKNKLFSIIAHDLRGPIGGLVMVLDMLNSGQLTAEEWKALLPGLKVNVDNLYSVTDNLLRWAYAQISGRQVHKTLFPVGEVVRHVVELMASHAQEKGIAIHNRVSPDLFLCADRDQLEVVLRNLVSNALKFSPRNAALVLEGDYADALAVIRVSDTGPGLPGEVLDNIQRGRFSQPALGTSGEKGTGIGLVMCKEFVEANEGTLTIAPNQPTGTTFVLTFNRP